MKENRNGKRGKKLKAAARKTRSGLDTVLASNPLIKAAADRANGAADALLGKARTRIASLQQSANGMYLRASNMQTGEIVAAGRRYVRRHPLRSGLLFATLGVAAIAAFPESKSQQS